MVYAHYFPLTSQGNIYSMTKLAVLNSFKLLIASLKREIICFEYVENATLLTPSSKEVLFTYIPSKFINKFKIKLICFIIHILF